MSELFLLELLLLDELMSLLLMSELLLRLALLDSRIYNVLVSRYLSKGISSVTCSLFNL